MNESSCHSNQKPLLRNKGLTEKTRNVKTLKKARFSRYSVKSPIRRFCFALPLPNRIVPSTAGDIQSKSNLYKMRTGAILNQPKSANIHSVLFKGSVFFIMSVTAH